MTTRSRNTPSLRRLTSILEARKFSTWIRLSLPCLWKYGPLPSFTVWLRTLFTWRWTTRMARLNSATTWAEATRSTRSKPISTTVTNPATSVFTTLLSSTKASIVCWNLTAGSRKERSALSTRALSANSTTSSSAPTPATTERLTWTSRRRSRTRCWTIPSSMNGKMSTLMSSTKTTASTTGDDECMRLKDMKKLGIYYLSKT